MKRCPTFQKNYLPSSMYIDRNLENTHGNAYWESPEDMRFTRAVKNICEVECLKSSVTALICRPDLIVETAGKLNAIGVIES